MNTKIVNMDTYM